MKYTDKQYYLDNKIVEKLDVMVQRCSLDQPKKDVLLICEGGEGEGKTNTSIACAYYVKHKTNRDIHLFFKLQTMIDFAQKTEKKIIIWDEPALDSLSTDWFKDVNKNLIRLMMMARKKQHFFICNFTKFHKFSEYIVVDRALGLIHMYSRNETEPGRFLYIRRKALEPLYLSYKYSKKRLYKQFASYRGTFPEVMNQHFSSMGIHVEGKANATLEDYEAEKDRAIESIGKKGTEKSRWKSELDKLRYRIAMLTFPIRTKSEFLKLAGICSKSCRNWRDIDVKAEETEEKEGT